MTDNTINVIQILMIVTAFVIAFRYALRYHSKEWVVTSFFYAVFAMGDIYYMLTEAFYHRSNYFYIPEIGWYSSYLFLDLLLIMMTSENERRFLYKVLWLIPVFTLSMFSYFVYNFGDVVGNIMSMLTMTFLMLRSGRGFIYLSRPESDGESSAGSGGGPGHAYGKERKTLYFLVFLFCVNEYIMWLLSCHWMGDTFLNPYYWFDFFLSCLMLLMIPAIRKAVNR